MYRGSAYSIDQTNDRDPADSIERNFQIALIGDTQVGKTSILNQLMDRSFNENVESTRGIDVRYKKMSLGSYLVKLRVWDSFGEDILKSIKEGRLKNIDAVMLVFDLTDEVSLENIMLWDGEIDQQYPDGKISKVLVGNKSDLPHNRKIAMAAKNYSQKRNIMYYETSAKTNHLILDSFVYLIKDLLNEKQIIKTQRTIPLTQQQGCCKCKCSCLN